MGIDLTDRSDLDWLSRGRVEGSLLSLSEESNIKDEFRNRLRNQIGAKLKDRDDSREFSKDEINKAIDGIINSVGENEIYLIKQEEWECLKKKNKTGSELVRKFVDRTAERIIDEFDKGRKKKQNKKTNSTTSQQNKRESGVQTLADN